MCFSSASHFAELFRRNSVFRVRLKSDPEFKADYSALR